MEWAHSELIESPVDTVWALATTVTDWPSYMPTVQSVERLDEGPLRLGSSARIKQPGQRQAVWTVTSFEPGHTFTWVSERRGYAIAGSHTVESADAGCRNTLTLTMTGPLAPVVGALLGPLMRRVLRTENGCFKARAEQAAVAAGQ